MIPDLTSPEHVVLVDPAGRPIGSHDKASVHGERTPLHLAFSLYLFDDAGRVLLTRRALAKRTWPGVWTNTCCGHPRLDEPYESAIARRLDDELGLATTELQCVLPDFAYAARDASGIQENEICPVYLGQLSAAGTVRANPAEVVDWAWTEWSALRAAVAAAPFVFSPWAVAQVSLLSDVLSR